MRIGLHTSTAGSLDRAAIRARDAGANTFQIFSSSPRTWRPTILDPASVTEFKRLREQFDLYPLAIHDSYLINLASPVEPIRSLSIAAFRLEIERALQIGAEYLVMHPGNYKDCSLQAGVQAIVEAMVEACYGLSSKTLTILLENTAGQGCSIGSRFEELAVIRDLVRNRIDFEIGYCLDTCHCYVAGMDISSARGLTKMVAHAASVLGLENVRVIHTNDSKGALGSHLDRHQHIGEGHIGMNGFRRILAHPGLRDKSFIIETPIDQEGDDRRNVQTLKRLSGGG